MIKKGNFFEPVTSHINFSEMEKEMIKTWEQEKVVEKYLGKNNSSEKRFSFLDGPITANNPMGVHHAWGRTYKDLWQRYFNMKGYKQRFQNGFDCQGLWVEVEVEKELNLKNKKDIENLVPGNRKKSIAKFVSLCKERVEKYSKIQEEQSKRLGYFMDWDNSYFTLSDENNYMIWHFLQKCHEKGLIYKGSDVVAWCPRCETAISEHEILTEDYKEVTHESLYLRFPLQKNENEFLAVWTTTPWTVPANIAIAVDEKMDYSLVEKDKFRYWVSTKLKDKIFGNNSKTIETVKGSKLVGLKYSGAFDNLPVLSKEREKQGFHEVIATDSMIMPIGEEEGTGLVHTSTGTGAEDHKLGIKLGLPIVAAIEDDASYLKGFGFLEGKNAKKHPELVIDYLKTFENGKYLYATENYSHRYPACWRCKKELVWKLTDEWYIAIDPVREDMKKVTRKIKWIPAFGMKRELDWLNNMHDWLISKKNRYWGLALPIWECKKCKHFEVIGGKKELKEKAVSGWEDFDGHSPHKPFIDEIKIKCAKCGEIIERIDDVGNPWLDAGIVSYSTISSDNKSNPLYLKDRKEWEKWFPADFITESFPGQFKNWFYSLIAMSTVLENREPCKTVLGFATLLAEDGRPMHKSWGNAIEFNEGAEKIGVDVMRWMYVKQNPTDNLLFGYKLADETRRKFHLTLWNIYNFFVTYANLDKWKPVNPWPKNLKNVLDIWIITRLREIIVSVSDSLNEYDAKSASVIIEDFVQDLSLWYIRRSRERVGYITKDSVDKNDFYKVVYLVLKNLCKIMAPFNPFISEKIFINIVGSKYKSVHLEDWPNEHFILKLDKLLGSVKNKAHILENMRHARDLTQIGHSLRKKMAIAVRQPLSLLTIYSSKKLDKKFEKLIKDELNVKRIKWMKDSEVKLEYDTLITPKLEEEAKVRELIRNIQQKRKEMGIELTREIYVKYPWLPSNNIFIQKIKKATLTKQIVKGNFEIIPS